MVGVQLGLVCWTNKSMNLMNALNFLTMRSENVMHCE